MLPLVNMDAEKPQLEKGGGEGDESVATGITGAELDDADEEVLLPASSIDKEQWPTAPVAAGMKFCKAIAISEALFSNCLSENTQEPSSITLDNTFW